MLEKVVAYLFRTPQEMQKKGTDVVVERSQNYKDEMEATEREIEIKRLR